MKKLIVASLFLALGLMAAGDTFAQQWRNAETYRPQHRMADPPNNTCPPGYTRLFGRRPPTCYQNCAQGWTVYSHYTSGATCVRCPPGWNITVRPESGAFLCTRPAGNMGTGGGSIRVRPDGSGHGGNRPFGQ